VLVEGWHGRGLQPAPGLPDRRAGADPRQDGNEVRHQLKCRGFNPRGQGNVEFSVPAISAPLKPIDLSEKGKLARVTAVLHYTQSMDTDEDNFGDTVKNVIRSRLYGSGPAKVNVETSKEVATEGKMWVSVVVETSRGGLFHGTSGEPSQLCGSSIQQVTKLSEVACDGLKKQLDTGSAVDEHLLDQLILPASLAAGKSRFLTTKPSLHAQTAMFIAEKFLPELKIRQGMRNSLHQIEIEGVGFKAP